ncbi:ABC transporter ATP-binding protein [Beggiatoa alba]|nr:ABC transporter ATP-binding protein [Beggiatoa alba]
MIQLRDIHKSYHLGDVTIPVLNGVSLSVETGEFVAIMGPSGSGKTTLLNIIGCLDSITQGHYYLAGKAIAETTTDQLAQIRNRRMGFVFQLFNLIPRINALRNVELPMLYAEVSRAQRTQRARNALIRVGMADREDHTPLQLSGGQQQRVAIARALVNQPDILVVDEPTGSLDSHTGEEIMTLFKALNATGTTIVMVTHEEAVARHARRIIRLRDGQVETDKRKTRE